MDLMTRIIHVTPRAEALIVIIESVFSVITPVLMAVDMVMEVTFLATKLLASSITLYSINYAIPIQPVLSRV